METGCGNIINVSLRLVLFRRIIPPMKKYDISVIEYLINKKYNRAAIYFFRDFDVRLIIKVTCIYKHF